MTRPVDIAYLFTTYPVLSETFNQREIRAMRRLPGTVRIHSLWGGGDGSSDVRRFARWRLVSVPWWLAYWSAREPRVMARTAARLLGSAPPSLLNFAETLIGLGFGLVEARGFERPETRPDVLDAVWATAPATAAQLIGGLTGLPFVMGAHAYDVFRNGGDWLLASKLEEADLILTSTAATRDALLARGARPGRVVYIRRGLVIPTEPRQERVGREPMRLISVGRLIEKKGYPEQLEIYRRLLERGFRFEARIVGAGPLAGALKRQARALGLEAHVSFLGSHSPEAVSGLYGWADVMLFTGKVARSGDRDGLPNVIAEAMAAGIPVVSTAVGGVTEALEHERTGLVLSADPDGWASALARLRDDDHLYRRIRDRAFQWVREHFDIDANVAAIHAHLEEIVAARRRGSDI